MESDNDALDAIFPGKALTLGPGGCSPKTLRLENVHISEGLSIAGLQMLKAHQSTIQGTCAYPLPSTHASVETADIIS